VNELPADAHVAIDDACLASRDAMADRADFTELFDIDMDELAGVLTLVSGAPARPARVPSGD
jgi:hypothetical protein